MVQMLILNFSDVVSENAIGTKPGYDYSELDKYGLIKKIQLLDDKKIVIGQVNSNIMI